MKYLRKTMHMYAKPYICRNAAVLRKNQTKAEEILWERLRKNQIEGVRFRRQHPFDRYVPDFYANSVKLVIEVDGKIHEQESVKEYDAIRELNLRKHSLYIIRYTNEEIFKKEDEVVDDTRMTVIELLKMKKEKRKR